MLELFQRFYYSLEHSQWKAASVQGCNCLSCFSFLFFPFCSSPGQARRRQCFFPGNCPATVSFRERNFHLWKVNTILIPGKISWVYHELPERAFWLWARETTVITSSQAWVQTPENVPQKLKTSVFQMQQCFVTHSLCLISWSLCYRWHKYKTARLFKFHCCWHKWEGYSGSGFLMRICLRPAEVDLDFISLVCFSSCLHYIP